MLFSPAGADHLWPFHRPSVYQPVYWVSLTGGSKRQRQVQPSQVLLVQGETRGKQLGWKTKPKTQTLIFPLSLDLPGIVQKLWRCLSARAAATYGTAGVRFAWEQATLRCWDHLWPDTRLQTLELFKGIFIIFHVCFPVLETDALQQGSATCMCLFRPSTVTLKTLVKNAKELSNFITDESNIKMLALGVFFPFFLCIICVKCLQLWTVKM